MFYKHDGEEYLLNLIDTPVRPGRPISELNAS